jgi:multidrug efflux pump subunit AcrA (membrane-fusion protein)
LGEAKSQLVELRETQEEASARLQELQQARAQALGEIEALRQEQLEQALVLVERNMRLNFRQEQARKQASLDTLCEELLQQDPPTILDGPEQEPPPIEEEGPPTKRARVESEVKDEPQDEEVLEDGELDEEEGQIMEEETPQSTMSEEVKPSHLKKQELEVGWDENVAQESLHHHFAQVKSHLILFQALESQMDDLTETKSQLIWLLKQVRRDKLGFECVLC